MSLRFTHVIVYISSLFFFHAVSSSIIEMYHSLFMDSFVNRHLDCFYFLIIMNKTSMNFLMTNCLVYIMHSFPRGYVSRSGIAGS